MKVATLFLLAASSTSLTWAAATQGATRTIMPLGDSRVEGARPAFESYRYELWQALRTDGWSFDFVGPEFDPSSYPGMDQQDMDREHFGIGGIRALDMRVRLPQELQSMVAPDIVLLGIGGNDLLDLQSRPVSLIAADIVALIDQLQAANPDVTIFLEQIAPGRSDIMTPDFTARLNAFNSALTPIPAQESTPTSSVILIDMGAGWSDAYMADQVHYNGAGAAAVAGRYRDALTARFGLGGGGIPGPIGMAYCVATQNSTGAEAGISGFGLVSAAANDVTLSASSLPLHQPGIFIVSRTSGYAPGVNGTSNGNLCLGGQVNRFVRPGEIQNSGGSGQFTLSLDLVDIPDGNGGVAVQPGETWSFQAWFRDPVGLGSNLSHGLELTFLP